MAIARNKKPLPAADEAAAIAAFGSAAEARPVEEPRRSITASSTADASRRSREGAAPRTSLIRWTDEELRAQIAEYSRRERYSMQHVMIEALRIGMQQLDGR